ncbi:helix-turn-helix domain-containing protein [Mesorhizobium sp. VK23B]|uniref:Helix-turn-helix domain-containing protein n=1 Tax=Mesorhizobium dulcispinae TaxID=3072316 RepID=A0ABU4XJU7_9HYPH|nr:MULTISPECIES: helix-turn-helix domain-containing protein [unclassified Mesorhizobium]MDX8468623.1 helix-turn-helix domain-containing protein [Mesorhizobium sp. VK23B]MDX8475036.1 helix-turn-helix domain-containing protein [Mesorhizobium sp. VK23A]MDX8520402.1 helix-turn-helix domain-containing protein [Mesorhizobium sp. VK23D]
MIKAPEVRSAELLDCAQRLFFERGYDDTTVNDIIREAGLSKGAFYHYFASKEALLEALAARIARESLAELEPMLEDPSLDAIGRLNALFSGSQRLNVELAPQLRKTFAVVFRPENVVLFHRIDEAARELALPMIARLLRKGSEEGAFEVPDPIAFADMLLQVRLIFRNVMHRALRQAEGGDLEEAAHLLEERLRIYGIAVDRLLKLPDGTIESVEPGFGRAFLGAQS